MNNWTRLGPHHGVARLRGNIRRYVTNAEGMYDIEGRSGYLPARSLLTIRPGSPPPTVGLLRPWGYPDDFRAAGGQEISPCGDRSSVHVHDSIMQRHAVALRNMETGELLSPSEILLPPDGYAADGFSQLPEFPSNTSWPWRRYDLQHLVRAFHSAILHRRDPAVSMDLEDMALDAFLSWSPKLEAHILAGPPGQGHAIMGRAWAWSAVLAVLVNNADYIGRMRRIALHVANPLGVLQRKEFGSFFGSPNTWAPVKEGGSGVHPSIVVMQDIEAAMEVVALRLLDLPELAQRLFLTAFERPKAKWIDVATGEGVGIHGPDQFNFWFALPLSGLPTGRQQEIALRFGVPRHANYGGVYPPAASITQALSQLRAWGDTGKSAWAVRSLGAKA